MKKTLIMGIAILALLLQSFSVEKKHKLIVKVYDLQNSKGSVVVMIYNKEGSIPDKHMDNYYLKKIVPVANKTAEVSFDDLPEGRYAVSIFHDENNNRKLDKGWMLPKEGVGLSKFKKVNLFHKPNFKKASFVLKKDTIININTIYF